MMRVRAADCRPPCPTPRPNRAVREVELALAREHRQAGWAKLRGALEDMALARRSFAERVEIVLRSAWGGDQIAARRVLAQTPEIGEHDICTAAATGNLPAVLRRLDQAAARGGPLDCQPLLYPAHARLPGSEANRIEIATLLLDHGADAHDTRASVASSASDRPLREEALVHGHLAMAALIERHGAPVIVRNRGLLDAAELIVRR